MSRTRRDVQSGEIFAYLNEYPVINRQMSLFDLE